MVRYREFGLGPPFCGSRNYREKVSMTPLSERQVIVWSMVLEESKMRCGANLSAEIVEQLIGRLAVRFCHVGDAVTPKEGMVSTYASPPPPSPASFSGVLTLVITHVGRIDWNKRVG